MTEQACCTLCGAAGHRAAQCNWNAPGALESIRLPAHGTTIALDEVLEGYLPDDREYVREVIEAYADIQARAAVMLFSGAGLASQQAEQCPQCAGTGYDCPDCIADFEREQVQGELWAVHAQGPDDLYAAFSREDAERHAAELNALPMPEGISVSAVVVASPWPAAEHWKYLAEQEREHNGALVAQAGRVPQAWLDVQAERRRQVEVEGWTPEHDDRHDDGKIAEQAAGFLMNGQSPHPWDWCWKHKHSDSPTRSPRRRQLVIGVALGLAEIERLDRAAAPVQGE